MITPEITSDVWSLLITAFLSYLIGSVPFGLLVSRLMGLGDIRKIGSQNIGATNVLRTGNKAAAAATLLLDGGKGAVAVITAHTILAQDAAQVAALASFTGHLFPVWLKFRGGKGVATFLGTLLALSWPAGVATCVTWLVVAKIWRTSSLSALVSAALSPLWLFLLNGTDAIALYLLLAFFIFMGHRQNVRRLFQGNEPQIGDKNK